MEENIKNLIVKYLSYQDADVSEEQKQRMLVYGMNSPISSKYANSLRNLFQEYDENEVHQLAKSLVKKLQEKMSFFEFISGYGVSHSWAYWDIAKQYHYFKNEANSETNYYLANPMTDEKLQNQIVMRMLGWEFYHFQDIEILREKIVNLLILRIFLVKYEQLKLGKKLFFSCNFTVFFLN